MKRLSWAVTFQLRLAQVLPPDHPMTPAVLRLLLAVDDVRRAQIQVVEAHERIDVVPPAETFRALGDFLYGIRLLVSHLHEAGAAIKTLDIKGKERVDALLGGSEDAIKSLRAVRQFFNAAEYDQSFVARTRNVIGFHYKDQEIDTFAKATIKDDTLLEATATEVGGLTRMADGLVVALMNSLSGGEFLTKEEHSRELSTALDMAGHLITVVDVLFAALIGERDDAIAAKQEMLVEIPELVQRARKAVEDARRELRAAGSS